MKKKKGLLVSYTQGYYSGRKCVTLCNCEYHLTTEIVFLVFSILTFILSNIWLYSWSVLNNVSFDIQEFLFEFLGVSIPVFLVGLVISILFHVYVVSVVMSGCIGIVSKRTLHMCLFHKIFIVFSCLLYIALFCALDAIWPGDSQWQSVAVSLEITGPFLQLCFLVCWVLFFCYFIFFIQTLKSSLAKSVLTFIYAIILIFLLTIPYWLYSPCIGKNRNALVKPRIFGHRGAPALAPENTILSFEKALQCGVYGLESDVRYSQDGVAFLMHDDTLLRTTNVKEVFPARQNDRPESFTWSELQQLNAGEWFLSATFRQGNVDQSLISNQKIPSFEEWVSFAATHNLTLLFDLFLPPQGHLNYNNYRSRTLQLLLDSGIAQNNVIWPLSYPENSFHVKNLAPGFRLMTYHPLDNPESYPIDIFNLPYESVAEDTITKYSKVSVIEYVVDTSLVFTRAWCQGAWAVTTNYGCMLTSISYPSWVLSTDEFFGIWITIELLCLVAIALIYYFAQKKFKANQTGGVARFFTDGESSCVSLNLNPGNNTE